MLDGGGVRGICCLRILQELMIAIEKIEVESYPESAGWPRLPCHYFELAGGTSTGG
jgi:patatin-like phospholipase/acyl hydrolase